MKLHRNIVEAILRSLQEIFVENKYADKVIERVLKSNPKWGGRDRRFIAETTYDIVRWYRLLEELLPNKERTFENIFNTYCEWKGLSPSDTIQERKNSVLFDRKIRESIPDWMDDLGVAELGEEKWEKEIHSLNQEAKVVLRANTLKCPKEKLQELLQQEGIETETSSNAPDALVLTKRKNIFTSSAFKNGWFEVQDASSQSVAPFMQLQDGMRVIDACAGAGGKTLHLAALMNNKGRIIALDSESWKLEELRKRARRAGATNIETRTIDSSKVIKRMAGTADRLLLDVPCSGMGVLRRNPDAKWKLSIDFIEKVKMLQQKILNEYSAMLKKGGMLVYSTCSIFPSENEKQVEEFLKAKGGAFELHEQKTIYPSEGFDGFFMARLIKK